MKRFLGRRKVLLAIDLTIMLSAIAMIVGGTLYWGWLRATDSTFASM